MIAALAITIIYVVIVWLVFFRFKVAKFNVVWAIATAWIGIHLLLVFLVGMRFGQPYTRDARIIRHTIQIVPRLPEPTLLTEVLVKPNEPVKQGDPLFKFDDRLYRFRVSELEAQLVEAKQQAQVLKADIELADGNIDIAKANVILAEEQVKTYTALAGQGAGRTTTLQEWKDKLAVARAQLDEANTQRRVAVLKYESQIDGVNTTVVATEARLDQAKYYLEQTLIRAPTDGFITNLQARPGLVVGTVRIGAIASFISDSDPYLLGPFIQEHLKFVKENQPVEVALDLYPGQIFTGTVESVWWATGQGQLKPSGDLPEFVRPEFKGKFAVKIKLDDSVKVRLPAGAQGAAAIYTDWGTGFAFLRRIVIRTYTWANWLYPLPI